MEGERNESLGKGTFCFERWEGALADKYGHWIPTSGFHRMGTRAKSGMDKFLSVILSVCAQVEMREKPELFGPSGYNTGFRKF